MNCELQFSIINSLCCKRGAIMMMISVLTSSSICLTSLSPAIVVHHEHSLSHSFTLFERWMSGILFPWFQSFTRPEVLEVSSRSSLDTAPGCVLYTIHPSVFSVHFPSERRVWKKRGHIDNQWKVLLFCLCSGHYDRETKKPLLSFSVLCLPFIFLRNFFLAPRETRGEQCPRIKVEGEVAKIIARQRGAR